MPGLYYTGVVNILFYLNNSRLQINKHAINDFRFFLNCRELCKLTYINNVCIQCPVIVTLQAVRDILKKTFTSSFRFLGTSRKPE